MKIRTRSIADGHCPECETFTLKPVSDGRGGSLPICEVCDWTGWPDDEEDEQ